MSDTYQQCTRCVMDNTSDKSIRFDKEGYCDYCRTAFAKKDSVYFPNEQGQEKLGALLEEIKGKGKGKKYDCIMGISGGLDSSYLAYLGAVKWGLRILAIHVNDGFNTEITEKNLDKLCSKAGIELMRITPNLSEFNDVTRAFILARVPNIAVPQDNIIFSNIYIQAKKYNISYFLSGANFALESILERGNTHSAFDTVNTRDIHKKHGKLPNISFPMLSLSELRRLTRTMQIQTTCPLDYIDYNRNRAIDELREYCGFTFYGSKHLENKLTAFAQLYWFPDMFGVDKRKSHLSSMIVSGQMIRDEAVTLLEEPLRNDPVLEELKRDVLQILDISDEEYQEILRQPGKQHYEYRNGILFNQTLKNIRSRLKWLIKR